MEQKKIGSVCFHDFPNPNPNLTLSETTITIRKAEATKCPRALNAVALFSFLRGGRRIAFGTSMTDESSRPVDLRSDTITTPTPAMREAMAAAEVGDDVFGEDPTVVELQAETAALLGKEAALFTPSGTMANQLAVRSHTESGDEIVVETQAHLYHYEGGGPAALSGVMCRCLPGERGVFRGADVEAVLRPLDPHFPRCRLVCVENTHNRGGGKIWPLERIEEVAAVARRHGLQLHLDGARLWNAAVATGIPESRWAAPFDTVSVCFSKGLGAPVGSALVGSKAFLERATRFRKMFGGGMRQAGIIAAGALFALRNHRSRLAEDHANAKALAEGISGFKGLEVAPDETETNMVRFRITGIPAKEIVERLRSRGVWVLGTDRYTIRAVTSLMVCGDDIRRAISAIGKVAHESP
jgi:threonine aldolase